MFFGLLAGQERFCCWYWMRAMKQRAMPSMTAKQCNVFWEVVIDGVCQSLFLLPCRELQGLVDPF